MDNTDPRERDLCIDLESGATTSEEEGPRDGVASSRRKNLLDRVWSGFVSFDGSVKTKEGISPHENLSNPDEVCVENVGLLIERFGGEERVSFVETSRIEKPKKKSCKKPPKPPRPPTAVLLHAADQKLAREITELTMLKKARVERMKALKKMKDGKTTSSSSSLCALAITIIFCLIIILQGAFSRSSSNVQFQGSPEAALATGRGLISVQYNRKVPARGGTIGPGSGSPSIIEPVPGSGTQEERSRFSG
ncbi:uncharacterized protein LOC131231196 [Magnolia sinica]|uniref:uncharacterized protein LOC131231196 n=1 Tax=Magnolia sinica TaxID=86752 RepID=UPI002658ACA3|nr:uncharacterized protein LOC131231196 [Magnolia sinica]XP_058083293.1 uncharacterized protein LOC131231196 [Magnolia sinica]